MGSRFQYQKKAFLIISYQTASSIPPEEMSNPQVFIYFATLSSNLMFWLTQLIENHNQQFWAARFLLLTICCVCVEDEKITVLRESATENTQPAS